MTPVARWLGRVDYEPTWRAMQQFTDVRQGDTPDEIWFLEHPPVYTLGMAAREEHVLTAGDIPVIRIDRGGQVTYHGPGQLVVYPLIDVRRLAMGVRGLVTALETAIVDAVIELGVTAYPRADAPGVYVDGRKLASIGLRIRRGATYHGLALNVSMDLEPFTRIDPCGYAGLEVTDLTRLGANLSVREMADRLLPHLNRALGLPRPAIWSHNDQSA
jgi:lipoyl(octanoyl) transferase